MISLNYLLKQIKDKANLHTQINTFAQGQKYDFSADSAILYPCLWAIPMGVSPGTSSSGNGILGRTVDYRISLFMMDIELSDGSNEIDILSDTAQILFDIVAKLDSDSNDEAEWQLSAIGNFEPFVDAQLDTVSGHSTELTFSVFYAKDTCNNIFITP